MSFLCGGVLPSMAAKPARQLQCVDVATSYTVVSLTRQAVLQPSDTAVVTLQIEDGQIRG